MAGSAVLAGAAGMSKGVQALDWVGEAKALGELAQARYRGEEKRLSCV
jgi:hypothetical protein